MSRPISSRPISPRTLTLLAFLAFVSLGLPDTLLGVAWPSVRATFDRPISGLGPVLACGAVGYLISSFLGGEIVRRAGVGRLLVGSTALVGVALAGQALTPLWAGMLAFAFVSGLGSGAIDAGINTFAAARFSSRVVNWLHACWGIGASVSPLMLTAILTSGGGWRAGYAVVAGVMLVMFALFLRTAGVWRIDRADGDAPPPATAGIGAALARPVVRAQMILYFVYAGVEVGAGQWLFTLLTESRGASVAVAGTVVGGFWASLTVGRVAFGQAATRLAPLVVIRIGLVGTVVGATLLHRAFPVPLNVAGVALLGFALAPIFPTIISDTPRRVGDFYAAQAVGFQVAGAAVGIATLPGAIGVLARRAGLEVVPLCLLAGAVALLVLHEWIVATVARTAASAPPSAPRASTSASGYD